jgi:hypothetical protein
VNNYEEIARIMLEAAPKPYARLRGRFRFHGNMFMGEYFAVADDGSEQRFELGTREGFAMLKALGELNRDLATGKGPGFARADFEFDPPGSSISASTTRRGSWPRSRGASAGNGRMTRSVCGYRPLTTRMAVSKCATSRSRRTDAVITWTGRFDRPATLTTCRKCWPTCGISATTNSVNSRWNSVATADDYMLLLDGRAA